MCVCVCVRVVGVVDVDVVEVDLPIWLNLKSSTPIAFSMTLKLNN